MLEAVRLALHKVVHTTSYSDGFFVITSANTTLFYNTKKLKSKIASLDAEGTLYPMEYKGNLYVLSLAHDEGVKQFYGIQLERELALQSKVLDIKKETLVVLEKAQKLKG